MKLTKGVIFQGLAQKDSTDVPKPKRGRKKKVGSIN